MAAFMACLGLQTRSGVGPLPVALARSSSWTPASALAPASSCTAESVGELLGCLGPHIDAVLVATCVHLLIQAVIFATYFGLLRHRRRATRPASSLDALLFLGMFARRLRIPLRLLVAPRISLAFATSAFPHRKSGESPVSSVPHFGIGPSGASRKAHRCASKAPRSASPQCAPAPLLRAPLLALAAECAPPIRSRFPSLWSPHLGAVLPQLALRTRILSRGEAIS